jgi:redox-sensitive bicupin YhaK (pirin superfamily)
MSTAVANAPASQHCNYCDAPLPADALCGPAACGGEVKRYCCYGCRVLDASGRKGGTLQMVQLWLNLRAKDKRAKAGYQTLLKAQIPNIALPQDAGTVRVIAGEFGGKKGAAKTFTPINVWDVNLRAGRSAELPLPDGHTTTFLVLSGEVEVNGKKVRAGLAYMKATSPSSNGTAMALR